MPRRATVMVGATTGAIQYSGAGTIYVVRANNGSYYMVYVDQGSDVTYRKSSDGITWGDGITVFTGTVTNLSIWYDRWTNGITTDYIHIAYTESVTDDTLYRTIDTGSSDALSTQTSIFAGASTANGGALSICRARGGNVYCATMIDAGTEGGFFRLPNANVPNGAWDAARATVWEAASSDMIILMPGWAADSQDMMAFFWDASANEISRKLYDDSANTWGETSIAASMTDVAATTTFPHFAGAPDDSNSQNLLVAWSAVDTANADLRCWTVTESAITEVTNVVLNSTDDQGFAAISIDTDDQSWHVFYGGSSNGAETYSTAMNVYRKVSKDSGTTWGPETSLQTMTRGLNWLVTAPRISGVPIIAMHLTLSGATFNDICVNVSIAQPRATYIPGIM